MTWSTPKYPTNDEFRRCWAEALVALHDVHTLAKTEEIFAASLHLDYVITEPHVVTGGGIGFGVKAYYGGKLIAAVTAVSPQPGGELVVIYPTFHCDRAFETPRAATRYADLVTTFAYLVEQWAPGAKLAIRELTKNIGKLTVDADTTAHMFGGLVHE